MPHLTDLEIAAFVDGGVPARQQARIAQHVHDCVYCAGRLEETRLLLWYAVQPNAWERAAPAAAGALSARRLLAGFAVELQQGLARVVEVPPGAHLQLQPMPARLDKPEAARPDIPTLVLPDLEGQFTCEVKVEPSGPGQVSLTVYVRRQTPPGPVVDALVELRDEAGGLIIRWRTDRQGQVSSEHRGPGRYRLAVTVEPPGP
jgi:hypothetical protein